MKNPYSHTTILFSILLSCLLAVPAFADVVPPEAVRYVHLKGSYTNDGLSWDTPKNDLQDAINSLHEYLKSHTDVKCGQIHVAGGTYHPTENTGEANSSMFHTTFKIYGGIEIYGGFSDEKDEAVKESDGIMRGEEKRLFQTKPIATAKWQMANPTILSGNHSGVETTFTWNDIYHKYEMVYPGNSYHVLWFATNGFKGDRALPLHQPAVVDGCIIEDGNAHLAETAVRHHASYGGGAYMVGGAVLRNCEIRRCHASRGGGAVMMDGGGRIENCYVHTNQCEGLGLVDGYGGGICVADSGLVTRSIIVDNMGRIGGGLALMHTKGTDNKVNRYRPSSSACIISNNTSSTEAGGVLLSYGGTLNHVTVVKNHCSGSEITSAGRRYGLSAGVFVEGAGVIMNSIFWGGKVGKSNLQYGCYLEDGLGRFDNRPYIQNSAVQGYEITDWTGTTQRAIKRLGEKVGDVNPDPEFEDVSDGVGVQANGTYYNRTFNAFWKPQGSSVVRNAGMKIEDLLPNDYLDQAIVDKDLFDLPYNTYATMGARIAKLNTYECALMESLEPTDNKEKILTLFVNPKGTRGSGYDGKWGANWEHPIIFINDALDYIRKLRNHRNPQEEAGILVTKDTKFQILVKQGEATLAGNYSFGSSRACFLQLEDNVRLYGGFPQHLKEVETSDRNPVVTPTILTGDALKMGKDHNSAHVVSFCRASNAILDGFFIERAYSLESTFIKYEPLLKVGGGILVQDATFVGEVGSPKPMIGNQVRNCVITNCTSLEGSAVWVKATRADVEMTFTNCIFNNNTSTSATAPSTVYVAAEKGRKVDIKFNHCDVLKNVGYGVHTQDFGGDVKVDVSNSVVWANTSEVMDLSENLENQKEKVRCFSFADRNTVVTGKYNLIDTGVALPKGWDSYNCFALLTYKENAEKPVWTYPLFVNPTKNIGAVYSTAQTVFGGKPDFTPRNMNPMVNMAAETPIGQFDITTVNTRDYGGLADIGAVENADLPKKGKVIYVRDYRNDDGSINMNDGGDGYSWATAINGNSTNFKSNQKFKGTDLLYPNGTPLTGLQWAVDEAYFHSLVKETSAPDQPIYNEISEFDGVKIHVGISSENLDLKERPISLPVIDANECVEVWVAAGEYLNRNGYIMREGVNVLGGFPNRGNPGKEERSPKESVSIIETNTSEEVGNVEDYATSPFEGWGPVTAASIYTDLSEISYDLNAYEKAYMTKRVLTQPFPYYRGREIGGQSGGMEYDNIPINPFKIKTYWDGFTIQNGRTQISSPRDGGAAVALRHNGGIVNCLVKNNVNKSDRNGRGGAIFCNGGEIINSVITENKLIRKENNLGNPDVLGGGLYLRLGTVYNTCFVKNSSLRGTNKDFMAQGAAVFFENGAFYNNTITDNEGYYAVITGNYFSKGSINMYNTIVYRNPKGQVNGCELKVNGDDPKKMSIKMGYCMFEDKARYEINSSLLGQDALNTFVISTKYPLKENFELIDGSEAINRGTDNFGGIIHLPKFDAAYDDRIQDCSVDIGAFEYNGAKSIKYEQDDIRKEFSYYVTQNGKGVNDGSKAAPACADKIQKILDDAGQKAFNFSYDTEKSTYNIIVRLAGSQLKPVLQPDGTTKVELVTFSYGPHRSSVDDENNYERANPRTWSLIVPRGVTLEGGWDDDFTKRDIWGQPTYISGAYMADELPVNVYHVITFTETIYSDTGIPMILNGLNKIPRDAVLDGLFIKDGQATGKLESQQYGAAAHVPAYAHIRNCVLENNEALQGGGALYLLPGAKVSGSLLKKNKAEFGGAIYVKENTAQSGNFQRKLTDMAMVMTSTIVENRAENAGGGIWFEDNVRVNSSVLWHNAGRVGANVQGQINPYSGSADAVTIDDRYPLAYTAVENVRIPGLNNLDVNSDNELGVRFENFENYRINEYSILARNGMPFSDYEILGLTRKDFMANDRQRTENMTIDMGALSTPSATILKPSPDRNKVLTRLFVAPAYTVKHYKFFQNLTDKTSIYAQKGSSFAYPMQSLEEALEYIRNVRNTVTVTEKDENIGFEIFLAAGTYRPSRALNESKNARDFTFAIPEYVSLFGGFENNLPEDWFCQETTGTVSLSSEVSSENIILQGKGTAEILEGRHLYDHNSNGIKEPWEMEHQTFLSGQTESNTESGNAYHVITCTANENHVGKLPVVGEYNPGQDGTVSNEHTPKKMGKNIILDGLEIQHGNALGMKEVNDGNARYAYRGAGVYVSGNWSNDATGKDKWEREEQRIEDPVGIRAIPLIVRNCRFHNNVGGEGAAIYSDGVINLFSCSFEQNRVESGFKNEAGRNFHYGNGGAISCQYKILAVNTMFENNEAIKTPGTEMERCGYGGAVRMGLHSKSYFMNCNFVRNKAYCYPALYFFNANLPYDANELHIENNTLVNSLFWGNESDPGQPEFAVNFRKTDNVDIANPEHVDEGAETLWFCAYEKGTARTPVVDPRDDAPDYREAAYDLSSLKTLRSQLKAHGDKVSSTDFDASVVTYNVYLNSDNDALDGPNFGNPSQKAGVKGYQVDADWMPRRFNNLVDHGWTRVAQKKPGDVLKFTGSLTADPVQDFGPYFSLKKSAEPNSVAHTSTFLPLYDEPYMEMALDQTKKIYRVSLDYGSQLEKAYIDIGVYEYRHVSLEPNEDLAHELDYLYVCETERVGKGDADGKTPETATSNVQGAIEALLASRNNHHKEVRFLQGTYTPVYTKIFNGTKYFGFFMNTEALNASAHTPSAQGEYGVASLSLTGGWSPISGAEREVNMQHPSVICAPRLTGDDVQKMKHLFWVENALQVKTDQETNNHRYDGTVVPIFIDGLVFSNEYAADKDGKGAAIYYGPQKKKDSPTENALAPQKDGHAWPKLTISRSTFIANGYRASQTNAATGSALKIEEGGGKAFVLNTMFHSNEGRPIDAVDTDVLNCTFAMNGNALNLTGKNSGIYNSVLWSDNKDDVQIESDQNLVLKSNAILNNEFVDKGNTIKDNTSLVTDNNDLAAGPNFVDPKLNATTLPDVWKRDFSLKPSTQLLNGANDQMYVDKVNEHLVNLPGFIALSPSENPDVWKKNMIYTTDRVTQPRWVGPHLDRGAYEFQSVMNNIVYVNPNNSAKGDGLSWQTAYNNSQMQTAIDMAAIGGAGTRGYVFMKGTAGSHSGNSLIIRPNIDVYGSIRPGYNKEVQNTEVAAYITQLKKDYPGIASPDVDLTTLAGLQLKGDFSSASTLLYGLAIAGTSPKQVITSPAVNLVPEVTNVTPIAIELSNCIISDFKDESGTGVVKIGNGLLYNVLVRDCESKDAVVHVAPNGYVVNSTLVADGGLSALKVEYPVDAPRVFRTLTYQLRGDNVGRAEDKGCHEVNQNNDARPFAPYFDDAAYLKNIGDYPNLKYQLLECSNQIEPLNGTNEIPDVLSSFIHYDSDRDLLGNPRKIGKKVDRGCFETWSTLQNGVITLNTDEKIYDGHYYPHPGSVVYVDQTLTVDDNFQLKEDIRPGYFLLKKGGWYSMEKAKLALNFAAVERKLYRHNLVSLPFDYDYASRMSEAISYSSGHLEHTKPSEKNVEVAVYDGEARAAAGYETVTDQSACWKVATGIVPANQGVAYTLKDGADNIGVLHRFTGVAMNGGILYHENEQPKTVVLQQYNRLDLDDKQSAGNVMPKFTAAENMGWNLMGMPYMVSVYQTGRPSQTHTGYAMDVPHLFYDMSGRGDYGTVESWHYDKYMLSKMKVGNAFFTQTAVIDKDEEILTFALPNYHQDQLNNVSHKRLTLTGEDGRDEVIIRPSAVATTMDYTLGVDGLKWMALDESLPQLYLSSPSGTRFSLLGAAPMERELPLGLRIQNEGTFTFALPDRDAFAECSHVWLADKETGCVTDLKKNDYVIGLDETQESDDRFFLKIGGTSPHLDHVLEAGDYQVSMDKGKLHVGRLQGNELIRVYDVSGRAVLAVQVQQHEFSVALPQGVYVVKVNEKVYKVR